MKWRPHGKWYRKTGPIEKKTRAVAALTCAAIQEWRPRHEAEAKKRVNLAIDPELVRAVRENLPGNWRGREDGIR